MRQLKITKSITNRSTLAVEKYLADISKIPLITNDREIELAQLIKKGDENALHELVRANLRFVVSVSKQYQNRGMELPDIINEGNMGLHKAALKFDETRGFKFISFAVWWVRQSILEAIANHGRLIRVPLNKIGLQNKFLTTFSALEQELQRVPSDDEIMEKMDIEAKQFDELLTSMGKVHSFDSPALNVTDGSLTLLDILIPSDVIENSPDRYLTNDESVKFDINRVLIPLQDRERHVIENFFGLNGNPPMSLPEISEKFGYSPERARQIKETALRKLRTHTKSNLLRQYLN